MGEKQTPEKMLKGVVFEGGSVVFVDADTEKREQAFSSAILLFSFAVIAYFDVWWPHVLLAIGASSCVSNYIQKRYMELFTKACIFVGVWLASLLCVTIEKAQEEVFLPSLFVILGVYVIHKYLSESSARTEKLEQISKEVDSKLAEAEGES